MDETSNTFSETFLDISDIFENVFLSVKDDRSYIEIKIKMFKWEIN